MKRIILLMMMMAVVIIHTACEKNPNEIADNFKLGLDVNFLEYTAQVEIQDLEDGSYPENIKLTPVTDYGTAILNSAGERNFKVSKGSITLILNPMDRPQSANEVKTFDFIASAPGYQSSKVKVSFTENNKTVQIPVSLLNKTKESDGVSSVSEKADLSESELKESKVVNFGNKSNKQTNGSVEVKAGTKFLNTSGKVLSGSSISMEVIDVDANTTNLVKIFPGGFTDQTVSKNGTTERTSFLPMSYTSINMYVGDEEVKDFSESINVKMEIDKNLYNPKTATKVKAGDQLALYSYELENGMWVYEKEVTITGIGNQLYANFETDHLTDYSLVAELPVCSDIFEINNPTDSNIQAKIELEIAGSTETRIYKIIEQNLAPGVNQIPYNGVGENISLKLYTSGNVITVDNISCGESPAIEMPTPDSELLTITINIPCEDVTLNIASYPIKYRKLGDTTWINGIIKDLVLKSYEMEAGNTYEFQIEFDGQIYTYEEFINSNDYQFNVDSELCSEINF
ncbi:hypothetical protein [Zunongwangia sp. HGR-M22]|uniref:hypothetical protein n=1 Tax=Zunongwangia sp. HGR-M22 TaxID=3015168 RepID=UPI0022DD509F|nr:hypothetical protein [Zunongwangia sp. HGR-M22]WBL24448.1 hypothetical protein PBT91_11045 [Zunongwangia sp. HGR-M22]